MNCRDLRHDGREDEDQERSCDQRVPSEDDADTCTPLHTASFEHPHDRVEPQRDEQRERDLQEERRDRPERDADDQRSEHADRRHEGDRERTLHQGEDPAPRRLLTVGQAS